MVIRIESITDQPTYSALLLPSNYSRIARCSAQSTAAAIGLSPPLCDRIPPNLDAWQEQNRFLDVGGQVEQVHDLWVIRARETWPRRASSAKSVTMPSRIRGWKPMVKAIS